MKTKNQPPPKKRDKPTKDIIPGIPASPEQIAKALFANDKKLPSPGR